jgi:hypothetical protein
MVWFYSMLSGFEWGVIGYYLARDTNLASVAWVGFAASPMIGLLIGCVVVNIRPVAGVPRVALSLFNLFLAAAVFGLALGIGDVIHGVTLPVQGIPQPTTLELVVGPMIEAPLGLIYGGSILALGPLSYLNHVLIWRIQDDRRSAGYVGA